MSPTTHLSNKLMAERARQPSQQQPQPQPAPETAPPPYTANDEDADSEDEDDSSPPLKITINAGTQIQGSNNLVPTSQTALADASRFSAVLMHAINAINNAAAAGNAANTRQRRAMKVDLTINCGIAVVGDRNVVGNVGLKQKPAVPSVGAEDATRASDVVAGAKRKAEEHDEVDVRPAKVPAVSNESN